LSTGDFRTFRRIPGSIVDPKNFDPEYLEQQQLRYSLNGCYFVLPAHSYGLGVAVERLDLPGNMLGICLGKSTYARCGILINCTPAEPGWRGHLTLEFSNSSDTDCRIYAGEGVAQMLFFEGDQCNIDYGDRNGKYQGQPKNVVLPKA